MGEHADMKFVLFLECSEQIMIDRIQQRASESGDAKREDDNIEVLQKRFNTFREQSMPIVELYEEVDKVRKIDATQDSDKVYADVCEALKEYL
jgi:UMP-CMP kinase